MNVLSNGTNDEMSCCDHEEADTRIEIHLQDGLQKGNGNTNILLRTVDTDVLAVACLGGWTWSDVHHFRATINFFTM